MASSWKPLAPWPTVEKRLCAALTMLTGVPTTAASYSPGWGRWLATSQRVLKWQGLIQVGDTWHTIGSYERITTLALSDFDIIDHRQQDLRALDFELIRKRWARCEHY